MSILLSACLWDFLLLRGVQYSPPRLSDKEKYVVRLESLLIYQSQRESAKPVRGDVICQPPDMTKWTSTWTCHHPHRHHQSPCRVTALKPKRICCKHQHKARQQKSSHCCRSFLLALLQRLCRFPTVGWWEMLKGKESGLVAGVGADSESPSCLS